MKQLAAVQLILGTVLLTIAVPAGARGNGGHGGHSHCVSQSRGHSSGMGASAEQSLASGSHGLVNCPFRLREGGFCPFHAAQVGGTFYPAEGAAQGAPESDLGPWWIFLFLGRGAVRGVRWLTGW